MVMNDGDGDNGSRDDDRMTKHTYNILRSNKSNCSATTLVRVPPQYSRLKRKILSAMSNGWKYINILVFPKQMSLEILGHNGRTLLGPWCLNREHHGEYQ
jgi:hypothetical protein